METPSPDPTQQANHVEWYRLALLLTGSAVTAQEILREVIPTAAARIADFRKPNSRRAWIARKIRELSVKAGAFASVSASGGEGGGIPECDIPEGAAEIVSVPSILNRSARLPEPARNAFALFHVLDVDIDDLAEIAGLRVQGFVALLGKARTELQPGESFSASELLRVYRPWGRNSPRVVKAVATPQKTTEEQQKLTSQVALDESWHRDIEQIGLPSGISFPAFIEPKPPSLRAALRQPAVLAIGIALLVVLGVCVFFGLRKMEDFPGKEVVSGLIDDTDEMSGLELEQITPQEAGKLNDWFVLKGFEDFQVPAELSHAKAVGCRVYEHDGHSVAQVALDKHNALLLVFRGSDMKVSLNTLTWRIFQQDNWAVAARGDGDYCYVVAFQGDLDGMEKFLRTAGK